VKSDRSAGYPVMDAARDIINPKVTGHTLSDARTDLPAPTPIRPPRPRRAKPKPKERWRYPEGLALKHARLLIERRYPLEDVAETIGSHPDDLRRVLEVGIAIRWWQLLGSGSSRHRWGRGALGRCPDCATS
jgi:hypothetical protein